MGIERFDWLNYSELLRSACVGDKWEPLYTSRLVLWLHAMSMHSLPTVLAG